MISKYRAENGAIIEIKKMTDVHLVNAYNFFMQKYIRTSNDIENVEDTYGSPEDLDDIFNSPLITLYPMQKMLKALLLSMEKERKQRKLKVKRIFEHNFNNSDCFHYN